MDDAPNSPNTIRLIRTALRFGIVPLPWFLAWTTMGGLLAPGYSALAQPARELSLAAAPASTMLSVAAIGSGLALCAFAFGLWRLDSRRGWGALAWAIYGVSMISNGCWPMTDPRHGLYGIGMVALVAPALSAMAPGGGPAQEGLRRAAGPISFALVFYAWAAAAELDPEGYRGATQRLFFAVRTLWPLLAGWVARPPPPGGRAAPPDPKQDAVRE